MEQKDRSCECNDIKNEIRADIQTYFDSMLKIFNARINTAEEDLVIHRRQYNLLSDQIDKLYYLFFANSVCILLITLPTIIRFIISFFN